MNTTLLQLGLISLAIGASASAQTYTTIMSGENSTKYSFHGGNNGGRTTVTSVQSPFGFPNDSTGGTDTQTYASGTTVEPWWFYYGSCVGSACVAYDLTATAIPRPPAIGQISSTKSSVRGLLANAALKGTVSNGGSSDAADMYEVFYFTERNDYQGQKEIGIARQMSPYATVHDPTNSGDYLFAYWYTNDNCGTGTSSGSPTYYNPASCQTVRANGSAQTLGSGPMGGSLLQTGANDVFICGIATVTLTSCATSGLTGGTTSYIFQTYIFQANWAPYSYYQRVEVWDSTFTTNYFADNLDTTGLGLTASGTSGYVTLGTVQWDPNGTLSSSTAQLSVSYVQTITP